MFTSQLEKSIFVTGPSVAKFQLFLVYLVRRSHESLTINCAPCRDNGLHTLTADEEGRVAISITTATVRSCLLLIYFKIG